MDIERAHKRINEAKKLYPEKFAPEGKIFSQVHRGDRIFIGTACGEPQYLVSALINYVESNPKAIFDAEVVHVWSLGVAPYSNEKFKDKFRHNSFFIGNSTREAVNRGVADYTPIFLSSVPKLFYRGLVPIDVALVQTSPPDEHGFMSLGVSVDIVKAAVETAKLVIVQVNAHMPRVHGDGFIHLRDIDFIIHHDEPLLEYESGVESEIAERIGKYVASIIEDGDTIQVGYGSIPNAIMASLYNKKHLGVHTELLSDGIVELMKRGVVDNSRKNHDRNKTIATFSMGKEETYRFLHDNPSVEFRTLDYTNNPLIIARNNNMIAINSALEVDLTGLATAESIGKTFYSGIGGQADFMRGAILSPGGKAILAVRSTAEDGTVSRIVPFLRRGTGVTLTRGDVHYVVTEFGIAYLHGKNIRERAMNLIAIAHPNFREELIEAAKRNNLIYADQLYIAGEKGKYPEELETYRTTKNDLDLFLRPVKISDEPLLKDFFYSLSNKSLYRRFISMRQDMPHERLQEFVAIDYSEEIMILAVLKREEVEDVIGLGQYNLNENTLTAEVALVVRDDYQQMGIGTEILNYLTFLAKRQGLSGFTAEILADNKPMLQLLEKMNFERQRKMSEGVYEMNLTFKR